jgi:thioredoxin reductase (NADPH)
MIKLFSHPDSAEGYQIRDFLNRSVVEFSFIQLDGEDSLRECAINADDKLPVVELPDGHRLYCPTLQELGDHLGFVKPVQCREYDLSIYGAGPAGLSAAVYAASEGLKVALVEKLAIGGQAGTSSLIENYIGFPKGIRGAELAEKARQQAVKFGAEILLLREGVRGEYKDGKIIGTLTDGNTISAKANICATGVEYQRLNVEGENDFLFKGFYYGAGSSEARMCGNEHVFVVGGGNSAGQAVLNFAHHAKKVTMLVRGGALRDTMSQYLYDRIKKHDNIEILYRAQLIGLEGDHLLKKITVQFDDGRTKKYDASKVFVCIGGTPNTEWATNMGIICKDSYLVTGPDLYKNSKLPDTWTLNRHPYYLETNLPGTFAAGDVRYGSVKRVAAAVGEGAMAVTFVHKYLSEL